MVSDFTSMIKDLKISPDEVDRFKNAFDDPEFKEIFMEYVKVVEIFELQTLFLGASKP